jgi:hypothetical protein
MSRSSTEKKTMQKMSTAPSTLSRQIKTSATLPDYPALSLKSLRWENFRWTGLRSEDLKEEKNVTAPIVIIAGRNSR